MKATLTYNLPEEADEHRAAINAFKWINVVTEFDNLLRDCLKYDANPEWDDKTVEALREKLRELMDEENLRLW